MNNLDRAKPGVVFTYKDKSHELIWNNNARAKFEIALGVSTISGDSFNNFGVAHVMGMLWAMLKKHLPKLALEEVGDWLEVEENMIAAMAAVVEAARRSNPERTGAEVEQKNG